MKLIVKSLASYYDRYTIPKPRVAYWGTIRCRNDLYTHHSMNAQNLWTGLDFYEAIYKTR